MKFRENGDLLYGSKQMHMCVVKLFTVVTTSNCRGLQNRKYTQNYVQLL